MIARLLALVAAVALVVGAVAFRASRDDDTGGGVVSTSSTIVCATELAFLCEAAGLRATIEPAAVTGDRLAALPNGADPALQAWVTLDPWPAIVAERRQFANREPVGRVETAGRTPVALAIFSDRARVLQTACAGEVTWRCLGEQMPKAWSEIGGDPIWGRVKVTHPDAEREASGLVAVGTLTASWFGRTDLSLIDIEEDDGFRDWFTAAERSVPSFSSNAVEEMLVRGPAEYDAAVVLEALADPVIDASPRTKPELIYPAPMMSTLLQVVGFGRDAGDVRGAVDDVRAELGWQDPSDAATGLPAPGLLDALRTTWREVAR